MLAFFIAAPVTSDFPLWRLREQLGLRVAETCKRILCFCRTSPPAAANILNDDSISPLHSMPECCVLPLRCLLPVGGAIHQDGKFASSVGRSTSARRTTPSRIRTARFLCRTRWGPLFVESCESMKMEAADTRSKTESFIGREASSTPDLMASRALPRPSTAVLSLRCYLCNDAIKLLRRIAMN